MIGSKKVSRAQKWYDLLSSTNMPSMVGIVGCAPAVYEKV